MSVMFLGTQGVLNIHYLIHTRRAGRNHPHFVEGAVGAESVDNGPGDSRLPDSTPRAVIISELALNKTLLDGISQSVHGYGIIQSLNLLLHIPISFCKIRMYSLNSVHLFTLMKYVNIKRLFFHLERKGNK